MNPGPIFDTRDLRQGICRELAPGLVTRVFAGENVMVSVVHVAPHGRGAIHAHREEQWGYLIEGSGIRTQADIDHEVQAGYLWYTPRDTPHSFTAGDQGAVILDIFSPPRPEYLRPGRGFGAGAAFGPGQE